MTILFDLDGTLIDSTEAILDGFDVAFRSFDLEPKSEEEIKALIGYPLDIMFDRLGAPKEINKDLVNKYKLHYRKISTQKTILLPFAKEAVMEASKIATLGIVTTKTAKYSKELMRYFGLMDKFEVLIGREDVTYPKPHPEPILKAIDKLKATKKDTFMIGDTCMDIISAKESQVNAIAVYSGYATKKELMECSKIIKQNSLEAVNYIKELSF